MSIKRADVVDYLRSLSDEALASLFYEATSVKNEIHDHEDGDFWHNVYIVGTATHLHGSDAEIEVLASAFDPDDPSIAEREDQEALQQGRCPVCRTHIACAAKKAKCPVCGAVVECT